MVESLVPTWSMSRSIMALSVDEVIQIHSEGDYLVYMIGFAPGFPFMGGLSERIATPRKETPRLAIVPWIRRESQENKLAFIHWKRPGGWQIIGRTPLDLFLPTISPPTLLQAGDKIRFAPISPKEYDRYKEMKL